MTLAQYFEKQNNKIICKLCPRECSLHDGQTGSCQIRTNINNELRALTYGKFCSLGIDPIEKKPLYHFYPNQKILSLGSMGCNFHCHHCQNWEISQPHRTTNRPVLSEIKVEEIIDKARNNNLKLVAFTYNEPLIQIETLLEYLPKLQEAEIKTVLVTNLYINQGPLKAVLPFVDALSIDIKAFNEKNYQTLTTAKALKIIKANIILCYQSGKHIELVSNLVADINDNLDELTETAKWINSVSPNIPWHITSFYPTFEYSNKQPLSSTFLNKLDSSKKSFPLNYVYTRFEQNTHCPNCQQTIIARNHFEVTEMQSSNTCPYCQKEVPYLHVC